MCGEHAPQCRARQRPTTERNRCMQPQSRPASRASRCGGKIGLIGPVNPEHEAKREIRIARIIIPAVPLALGSFQRQLSPSPDWASVGTEQVSKEGTMSCCTGTASYFCCCPDRCGCDLGCCQGCNNCNYKGCDQSKHSSGSCCSCVSSQLGFAWPYCGSCGLCPGCGSELLLSSDCTIYYGVPRVDVGPNPKTGRILDMTKFTFTQFAPLWRGIITNFHACTPSSSC